MLSLAALLSLVPASVLPFRRGGGERGLLFWLLLGAAVAGPAALILVRSTEAWSTGLSMALWISIATSIAVFAGLALIAREAWRLAPLLLPYLLLLAVLAIVWEQTPIEQMKEVWNRDGLTVSIFVSSLSAAMAISGSPRVRTH